MRAVMSAMTYRIAHAVLLALAAIPMHAGRPDENAVGAQDRVAITFLPNEGSCSRQARGRF